MFAIHLLIQYPKDIDISLSTVKRAIPEFVDKGYLKKINRKRKNGSSTSNLYKFTGKVYGTG